MASVFSHTYLCSSPNPRKTPPLPRQRSQRSLTLAVDSAHVPGLIRVVVPWRRGARRRQPCQRAFKGTLDPQKKGKQMAAGNDPARALHLFSPGNHPRLPGLLFNQWPIGASGGFEVEECLNAAPVHAASHHKAPEGLPGPRRHTFSSQTEVNPPPPTPSSPPPVVHHHETAGRLTNTTTNKSADTSDEQHIEPSRERSADWKKRLDKGLFVKNKSIKGNQLRPLCAAVFLGQSIFNLTRLDQFRKLLVHEDLVYSL